MNGEVDEDDCGDGAVSTSRERDEKTEMGRGEWFLLGACEPS